MGLATLRICLIGLTTADGFVRIFFSLEVFLWLPNSLYYLLIDNSESIKCLFATSLSIFYFLKMANFSHHIFLWLRSDIKRVLLLLMGYLLISSLVTFPLTMKIISDTRAKNRSAIFQLKCIKGNSLETRFCSILEPFHLHTMPDYMYLIAYFLGGTTRGCYWIPQDSETPAQKHISKQWKFWYLLSSFLSWIL